MNMEKMKEIFADEAFVKSLFELESAGEVQAALKEKGVELPEELLEQVSGGSIIAVAAVIGGFAALTGLLYGVADALTRRW